jgi:preprotein translocase subunit SecG
MLSTLATLVPTLATNWLVYVMATFFVVICLFMMLVILIQKPKGGGLSGAFGGAGSAQSVMGAKTGEFLTWFTVACFVLFLLLAMGLTWAINADPHSPVGEQRATTPVPPPLDVLGDMPADDTPDAPPDAAPPTP